MTLAPLFMDEVHQQLKADDFDVQRRRGPRAPFRRVGQRKERLLGRAFGDGHDQFVEQRGGAPHEVLVTRVIGSKVPG